MQALGLSTTHTSTSPFRSATLPARVPPGRSSDAWRDARVITCDSKGWTFHDARLVSRFYASDKYTCFVSGGCEQLTVESLNSLEIRLAGFGFLRVHRSQLVNVNHVTGAYCRRGALVLSLLDDQVVPVSRRQTLALRRYLQTCQPTCALWR
jgi:DNA-binding LytR/AlgR family response regulator